MGSTSFTRLRVVVALVAALLLAPAARADEPPLTPLEQGFRSMYGLDFASARRVFEQWREAHPLDPLGPMAEAASILFAELDRSGVLQAQFLVNDSTFTVKKASAVPPSVKDQFETALADAERLARARLRENPREADALFAQTMVYGLRADYSALIEGRGMASLSYTRQATRTGQILLGVAPDYADAYLSIGISQYIVGSLIAPLRWVLRIAGYSADKSEGMEQLKLTADRGRFLGPFARILLTIAYLREHDTQRARAMLVGLEREFPTNPLFARELERIDRQTN